MFHVVIRILLLFIYMKAVVDQLPRLGKRELICLLLFTEPVIMWFLFGEVPLPPGAWDGLRYLIVALPEPSIQLL